MPTTVRESSAATQERAVAAARDVLEGWVSGHERGRSWIGRYWRGTGRPRDAFTLTPREARDWAHDHGPGGWGGVMFHGTSSPAAAAIRAEGFRGHAWTASDIEFAVGYTDAETTNNVQRVAIRLERPYVTARQGGIGREEIMAFDRRHPALEYTHALAAEGYDGLVEVGPDGVTRLVVAFQPGEQVRIIANAADRLSEAARAFAAELLEAPWDESSHPRAKTTPGTNRGSFAPASPDALMAHASAARSHVKGKTYGRYQRASTGVNRALRAGPPYSTGVAAQVRVMDELLAKSPELASDTVFWRGVPEVDFQVGDVLEDPAFTYLSGVEDYGSAFGRSGVILEVQVPRGTRVFATSPQELLLPRGSRFEVLARRGRHATVRLVETRAPAVKGSQLLQAPRLPWSPEENATVDNAVDERGRFTTEGKQSYAALRAERREQQERLDAVWPTLPLAERRKLTKDPVALRTLGRRDLLEAADSMRKATTPKRGLERKRGGPDNWVERSGVRQPGGRGLPPYIQHIALALKREKGMPTSRAIATAVNAVKRWARGGGDVDAGTRSAASLALSQWTAMKARSKAGRVREADLCEADLEGMALLVAATILEADQSD